MWPAESGKAPVVVLAAALRLLALCRRKPAATRKVHKLLKNTAPERAAGVANKLLVLALPWTSSSLVCLPPLLAR